MTEQVSTRRYPIAAILNFAVSIVLVIAWAALVFGLFMLGIGIVAEASGGELSLPFGKAYTENISLGGFIVAFTVLVAMLPGVIFICGQLKRILTTLTEGEPFVPENAGRLVRIAFTVAAMELVRYAITFFAMFLLQDDADYAPPKLAINLAAWIAVAVLFVLSQVFSEGTRLREEEKMTI